MIVPWQDLNTPEEVSRAADTDVNATPMVYWTLPTAKLLFTGISEYRWKFEWFKISGKELKENTN